MTRWLARASIWIGLAACGSTSAPPPAQPVAAPRASSDGSAASARAEAAHKQELSAAHNKLLDEQATALAATCAAPAEAPPRCAPSCYAAEPADPRAGSVVAGIAEIGHVVCTRSSDPAQGPFAILDEVGGKLAVRALRGRIPKAAKKGSWQATVEAAVAATLAPEVGHADAIRVTGSWKSLRHPGSLETLRCVTVAHYAKSRTKLDACGSHGAVACEATGNAAAHGLNVIHYRLVEARRFHAAHDEAKCQLAALEAIAVARGMPRWRQYVKLNTDQWKASPRYRTRFDGILDEDALFETAIGLGTEAQDVYASCGGAANPTTRVADEQSFHTCP